MLALPPRRDPPAEHQHFSLLIVRRAVTLLVCVQQITYVRAVLFIYLFILSCCSLTDPQMAVCDSHFELKVLVITVQSAASDRIKRQVQVHIQRNNTQP